MKFFNYRLLIAGILSLMFFSLMAQTSDQIIPVSPEAAALAKAINYPVDFNTGVPDISIPIYEINVGGLKLPVALNYHASGFRINEQATRAGLGWSLSSDLQIMRTINGKDDFTTGGYISNALVKAYSSSCTSCSYPFSGQEAYFLTNGDKDASPDKFSYKLLGKSGSFYFQKNNAGTAYTIVPVPFDNIEIQFVAANNEFIITDTDGTVYYFGGDSKKEISGSVDLMGGCGGDCAVSAWKCSRIVNKQGTDEISFTYTTKSLASYRSYNDVVTYYNNESPCGLSAYYRSNLPPMNNSTLTYTGLLQQVPFYQISSPKYMVSFGGGSSYFHVPYLNSYDQVNDRTYEDNSSSNTAFSNVLALSLSEISFRGGKVQLNGADNLNYIKILDANNSELKTAYFFQSYTTAVYVNESKNYNGPNFQGTRYLDSLHIRNCTNTFERYALIYNQKFCYGNHLKGHDAWGYPNASTQEMAVANNPLSHFLSLPTMGIIQERFYRDIAGGCSNFASNIPVAIGGNDWAEVPSEPFMKRGMLKRIIYPTGGYADFDFEANQYMEEFTGTYHHTILPQLSGGLRIRSITSYDADGHYAGQKYYRYGELEEGSGILVNRPGRTLEYGKFHYDAVNYLQRIAYLKGAFAPQTCSSKSCLSILGIEDKTTYQPASVLDYTYGNGAPIYYSKVTEYNQDLGQKTGKTVYQYYKPDQFYDYAAPFYTENRIPGTNFSFIKTDGLMGAQKMVAEYKYLPFKGYQIVHKKQYEYTRYLKPEQIRVSYAFMRNVYNIVQGNFQGNSWDLYGSDDFVVGEYGIPSARLLPSKETETSYENNDSSKVSQEYAYEYLPYTQASKITTSNSKGQVIAKELKYPYNFSGTPVYDEMVSRRMFDQLVEERVMNTSMGKEISHKKTNFKEFEVGLGVIAPETLQSSIKGQALKTDVTFNGYDQYANVLQQTPHDGIPVSYLWGYNYLYPVAELSGVTYASIPSSYKSNVQITNPTSDASLRTLLSGLQSTFGTGKMVNLYTYKRLSGMSSKIASNGYTSYYEYDPVGRLVAEKEHDLHLVHAYEYHMKGPQMPAASYLTYTNVPIMRSHNYECSPGIYQLYNHIVPGGTYTDTYSQASADNYARNEADIASIPVGMPSCPAVDSMASIQLLASTSSSAASPQVVEVDFVKDGSVIATHQFYSALTPANLSTFRVPPGVYQVSIRISADVNYQNGCLTYGLYSNDDDLASYPDFQSGDTVTFENHGSYLLQIGTILYN